MRDIQNTVNQWISSDQQVGLATVVETWGSAPRGQGAKLAATRDLAMIGSVSGGCIEGAVLEEMIVALDEDRGHLLSFGVSDDTAWSVGLTCGGRIRVFVEPLDKTWWNTVTDLIQRDQKAVTVTALDGDHPGQKMLLNSAGEVVYAAGDSQAMLAGVTTDEIMQVRWSGPLKTESGEWMVDVHHTRPHLIIIGGVHVAIPLQSYARQIGFRVSIIDPRKAFATEARFPDVDVILHEYPDKALGKLGLDGDTYVAVLTHDPKIDDPALITALPSTAPYVGVLSSARTHQKRLARLTEAGISAELQARITTPIGIDIGARTPEEIALCIMAQIVAVRNGVKA